MRARQFLAMLAAMLVAVGAQCIAAAQEVPVPRLTGHVVDLAGTLDDPHKAALDAKLSAFEREHGSQVVVLLVPTTGTEPIEDFAGRVTDEWKLGRNGVDDGVLFVAAMQDHKLRIQTGRGVQGTLTDVLSKRIVSDLVAPYFRKGDFAGGLAAGTDAIMKAIEGESLPLPAQQAAPRASHAAGSIPQLALLAFIFVPMVGLALRGVVGRFFGAVLTSGLTGVVVWFFLGSLVLVGIAAFLAFFFTLFSGMGLARGIRPGLGGYIPTGGWGGGGFGGGGFGGGGGGGFSGGGGSFDGGGASGSW